MADLRLPLKPLLGHLGGIANVLEQMLEAALRLGRASPAGYFEPVRLDRVVYFTTAGIERLLDRMEIRQSATGKLPLFRDDRSPP